MRKFIKNSLIGGLFILSLVLILAWGAYNNGILKINSAYTISAGPQDPQTISQDAQDLGGYIISVPQPPGENRAGAGARPIDPNNMRHASPTESNRTGGQSNP